VEAVRGMVRACAEKGIQALTLFAFSSENWRRPPDEVSRLMGFFGTALERQVRKLDQNDVCLRVIGDRQAFSPKLQKLIDAAEKQTADNQGLTLVIAANYGGRWDIAEAAKRLALEVRSGSLDPESITPEHLAPYLSLGSLPEPDLFIRTGGEKRVSNFLLWQLAYTEFHFTDTLWPDFDRAAFEEALASFATRQRRFGRTGKQVAQAQGY